MDRVFQKKNIQKLQVVTKDLCIPIVHWTDEEKDAFYAFSMEVAAAHSVDCIIQFAIDKNVDIRLEGDAVNVMIVQQYLLEESHL